MGTSAPRLSAVRRRGTGYRQSGRTVPLRSPYGNFLAGAAGDHRVLGGIVGPGGVDSIHPVNRVPGGTWTVFPTTFLPSHSAGRRTGAAAARATLPAAAGHGPAGCTPGSRCISEGGHALPAV